MPQGSEKDYYSPFDSEPDSAPVPEPDIDYSDQPDFPDAPDGPNAPEAAQSRQPLSTGQHQDSPSPPQSPQSPQFPQFPEPSQRQREPQPDDSDPLLADLTAPQREAVKHVDGPLLILAAAGSGKTRVITRRIAYLVTRQGIPPWNILALTFTNKAAGEMRERMGKLLTPKQVKALTVCTFHALCARIIRQYADRLGLPPGFSIYDSADQQRACKTAIEALELRADNFPPAKVMGTISNAKNDLIDADAYAKNAYDFNSKHTARIYARYQQILMANQAVDFDDLMLYTIRLMREHPDVLNQLRMKYQYIQIDEYQDTNFAQFTIASTLAPSLAAKEAASKNLAIDPTLIHQNICATGDPDQSIYGWRGADIKNILNFETHYPSAKTVRLEQNYRSSKRILAVADALIKHNKARKHKALWTENQEGEPVTVITCADEKQEAQYIVDEFKRLNIEQNIPFSRMAVFYRINSLSRVPEESFRVANVPYQIARGTAFYDRKEIKDAISYLRTVANPADEVNLSRIINFPTRGISDTTVQLLQTAAIAANANLHQVITTPRLQTGLPSRAAASVQKFAALLDQWRFAAGLGSSVAGTQPAASLRDLVENILRDSGLEEHYKNDKTDPDQERFANLSELVNSAQQFEDDFDVENEGNKVTPGEKLFVYLERISLVSDVDSVQAGAGAVTLMTLHAAKGLEFPVVAMIGMEDGLLPHKRATESRNDKDLEEERRLAFVGITRAQERLYLSFAKFRQVFGQTTPTIPSRFLRELPPEQLHRINSANQESWLAGEDRFSGIGSARDAARDSMNEFPPGTWVKHPSFGIGRIMSITTAGAQTRAQVSFQMHGVRTLILQYARLEKVNR
jgi:DNA helicase II / ATP-dependent DNA helicase PcrA